MPRHRNVVVRCLVPLSLVAAVAGAAPGPAAAQEQGAGPRGYLQVSDEGERYVYVDDAIGTRRSSPLDTTDGALGPATGAGPLFVWVQEQGGSDELDPVQRLGAQPRDGGDTVYLYTGRAGQEITEPAVSGDGRSVVFALDDEDASALVVVDVATRAARVVRRSTSTTYTGPSFSPDGVYLSWTQGTSTGSDLVVAQADGTAASVLLHRTPTQASPVDSAWSPDGSQLAVALLRETDEDLAADVAVVDARTAAVRTVAASTDGPFEDTVYLQPAWSPRGDRVLASRLVLSANGAQPSLVSVAPDGSDLQEVPTQGYGGSPSTAAVRDLGDTTPPAQVGEVSTFVSGALARLTAPLATDDRTLADVVVTRDDPATPTAGTALAGRSRDGVVLVSLPAPGTTYTFSAYARDWSGNLAAPRSVQVTSPDATSLSVSTPPGTIDYRASVRLTGRLEQGGRPLGGQRVVLLVRRAGTTTPAAVRSATTAADGSYALSATPSSTAEYAVRFDGTATGYPSVSAKRVVRVRQLVSLTTSAARVAPGAPLTLSGSVAPARPGAYVSVQRLVGGTWRTFANARLSSGSGYRYVYRSTTRGPVSLRVTVPATGDRLAAVSPARRVEVR